MTGWWRRVWIIVGFITGISRAVSLVGCDCMYILGSLCTDEACCICCATSCSCTAGCHGRPSVFTDAGLPSLEVSSKLMFQNSVFIWLTSSPKLSRGWLVRSSVIARTSRMMLGYPSSSGNHQRLTSGFCHEAASAARKVAAITYLIDYN